ncbi:MAG: hypothetical protein ACP5NK_03105 [Thermoplasmata archaeon]
MNGLLDLEEVKSFMLMGDVRSSIKWLERRKIKSKYLFMATKKNLYVEMEKFLDIIEELIKGNINADEAESELTSDKFSGLFYMVDNIEELVSAFVYYIQYTMDRYDVEYPGFDQKRCDDL